MEGATHFIEQFRDLSKPAGRVINAPCNPIAQLPAALSRTHNALVLKTIAVFKIKLKPDLMIASFDPEVSVTIIEEA